MRNPYFAARCLTITGLLFATSLSAQNRAVVRTEAPRLVDGPVGVGRKIGAPTSTANTNRTVAERVAELMEARYVSPSAGRRAGSVVRAAIRRGAYDRIGTDELLASALAADLRGVVKDGHLDVFVDRSLVASMSKPSSSAWDPGSSKPDETGRRENHGLRHLEVLAGNIGYLEVREFAAPAEDLERAYASALTFLKNADAIVIDLRRNGGGHGSSATLLAGGFFAAPVRFVDHYDRPSDRRTEGWTPATIPWQRRPEVPLYVLTSKATYSAAEAIAYGLQATGRATIVGEATGGGAHPTEYKAVSQSIVLALPESRSEHPVTRRNWQDVGVQPEVIVAADAALERAHLLALERIRSDAADPTRREALAWDIEYARSRAAPAVVEPGVLKELAGRYGLRDLSYEPPSDEKDAGPGSLFYRLEGRPRFQLFPVMVDGTRIRFVLDENDRVEMTRRADGVIEMRKFDRSGQSVSATRSTPGQPSK